MTDDVVDAEVVEDAPGEWVLVSEAAELAGVSRSWVRKMYRAGLLPHREVEGPTGPAYEVPIERVHQLVRERSARTQSPEPSTSEVVRRADFDAWVERLQATFHALAADLADARERAGAERARADAAEAQAARERDDRERERERADEAAGRLRAEVMRLREIVERDRVEREVVAQRRRFPWSRSSRSA